MVIDDDARDATRKSHLFMVRFWMEDLGGGQIDWRAKIQHVNSGEVRYFREWPALEDFVKRYLLVQEKNENF